MAEIFFLGNHFEKKNNIKTQRPAKIRAFKLINDRSSGDIVERFSSHTRDMKLTRAIRPISPITRSSVMKATTIPEENSDPKFL